MKNKNTQDEIIEKLTQKYYFKITKDCIEYAPNITTCFELRDRVVSRLFNALELDRRKEGG